MSISMLERAAQELAPFLDEVAFVGGATVALWLTDPAGPRPRVTKDVDVVVEVATRVAWYQFEERLTWAHRILIAGGVSGATNGATRPRPSLHGWRLGCDQGADRLGLRHGHGAEADHCQSGHQGDAS